MKVQLKRPNCPFCRAAIEAHESKVGCPGCMAWQHAACLRESRGCAACGRPLEASSGATPRSPGVEYRIYRSTWSSWETLFADAAEFATWAGPERLISVSHSADQTDGVVTVWYRSQARTSTGSTLRFQVSRGSWDTWETLFTRASEIAQDKRVVSISHSEDKNEGVVAVWYWAG